MKNSGYYCGLSNEDISEIERNPDFLSMIKRRREKLSGEHPPQFGLNGFDADYYNAIGSITSEIEEIRKYGNTTDELYEMLKELQGPIKYWNQKLGGIKDPEISLRKVAFYRMPDTIPIIEAIDIEIEKLKKIGEKVSREKNLSEDSQAEIEQCVSKINKFVYECGNVANTIFEIREEISRIQN